MDEERDFNPYAPPKAKLEREQAPEPETPPGEWSATPYRVPAVNGLLWLWQAGRLFVERPVFWTIVLGVVVGVRYGFGFRHLLPSIELDAFHSVTVYHCLWWPLCSCAVVMAHRQSEGRPFFPVDFLSSFGNLLLTVVPLLLTEPIFINLYHLAVFYTLNALGDANAFIREHPLSTVMLTCPVLILYYLILFGVPPLVALCEVGVLRAIWLCLRTMLRNWGSLLTSGLLPLLVAHRCLHLFLRITGYTLSGSERLFLDSLETAMHAVLPLVGYVAARDIFYNEE